MLQMLVVENFIKKKEEEGKGKELRKCVNRVRLKILNK